MNGIFPARERSRGRQPAAAESSGAEAAEAEGVATNAIQAAEAVISRAVGRLGPMGPWPGLGMPGFADNFRTFAKAQK